MAEGNDMAWLVRDEIDDAMQNENEKWGGLCIFATNGGWSSGWNGKIGRTDSMIWAGN